MKFPFYASLLTLNCCTSTSTSQNGLFYNPRSQFDLHNIHNASRKKIAKRKLLEIEAILTSQEQQNKDTSCARQIVTELKWIANYTRDFARFDARAAKAIAMLSSKLPAPSAKDQSRDDGSWGICFDEWFFKLDASSEALDELSRTSKLPKFPVRFMERINSPEKLIAYLDSILISDIDHTGKDNRKELNYSVSALLRTVIRNRPANFSYHQKLSETLKQYIVQKWQKQENGYWGAWYRKDGKIVKTDDLSITFHIVSYLNGQVPHLGKIAATTYANRTLPYPYGLLEEGNYTNHHNYDAVRLFRYGWKELTDQQKKDISTEIGKMLHWCLKESLQKDGSFVISKADDSFSDAFYFGISFLDETGFFDPKKRFWTNQDFPQAEGMKAKIIERIGKLQIHDYMLRSALEKLKA